MDGGRKTDVFRLGRYFYGTKKSVHGWNNCLNTHLCDWVDHECLDALASIHVKHLVNDKVCILTDISTISSLQLSQMTNSQTSGNTRPSPDLCSVLLAPLVPSVHTVSVLRSLNSKPT
ncbi:hypothetical protein LPJ59_007136, partial [Coemansia sp. RSA 2399]